MDKPNPLTIPAFKRKRSLVAKQKRLERKPLKKTRARKTTTIRERITVRTNHNELSAQLSTLLSKKINDNNVREMIICGKCEGYFERINVAIINLISSIKEGDRIIFTTNHGLFEQTVNSMQINREDVVIAHAGDDIGMKVKNVPTVGTNVYKVIQ